MSSWFFVSILSISIVSILFSVYFHKPEFPPLEVEKDNYWKSDDPVSDDPTIRKFTIDIDEKVIESIKSQFKQEHFVSNSITEDSSEISDLLKVLKEFDWIQHQNFFNTFKQYRTEIEGLDIHFLRISTPIEGKNKKVIPLLMIHGFPGSFWDFFKVIPILTNPSRHGFDFGVKETIQFEVVVPSLPGFIFSEKPQKQGLDGVVTARILSKLMKRLDFQDYFVYGCEGYGGDVATLLGSIYPNSVSGIHISNPFVPPTFSTITLGKYAWNDFMRGSNDDENEEKNEEDETIISSSSNEQETYTSVLNYFEQEKFESVRNSESLAISFSNSALGTAIFLENRIKQLSTFDGKTQLHEIFTLDEIATEIYLYLVTKSLPSSLIILDNSYNHNKNWMRAQVRIPTSLSYSKTSPWKTPEEILKDKYLNVTRISNLPNGGMFHHLQDAKSTAEDIFSFVELQLV